jgi:hypothetical protein
VAGGADLLYRAYRAVRLRNVGDTRPAASLLQAVEHQALAWIMAGRAGVRVPGAGTPGRPPGVQVRLLPFGEAALEHFVYLERPEGIQGADAGGFEPAGLPLEPMRPWEIIPRGQDFATVDIQASADQRSVQARGRLGPCEPPIVSGRFSMPYEKPARNARQLHAARMVHHRCRT